MTEFYTQIYSADCTKFSLIFEDDGRVCYAYLLQNTDIIGDIWLYNQSPTPLDTIWNKTDLPFLNPAEFVKDDIIIQPITSESEIDIGWSYFSGECILGQVKIFVRGKLLAIMKPGSTPGWSIAVKKDGPLAKKLINE